MSAREAGPGTGNQFVRSAGTRPASGPAPDVPLIQGLPVYDEVADRFGTVAEAWSATDLVSLRPLGGGLEWDSRRGAIRPALTSEVLAARVRAERIARAAL